MKNKSTYAKTHCSHYCLGECSQEHHKDCVGTDRCIKWFEDKLKKLKEDNHKLFNDAVQTRKECVQFQVIYEKQRQITEKLKIIEFPKLMMKMKKIMM